jgi:betaine-aldehyde dehydrogenase
LTRKRNYIGGEWTEPLSGEYQEVIDPATEEPFAEAPRSSAEDAEAAVAAARRSFYETREWRDRSAEDRAEMLRKIRDLIHRDADEIAEIETRNQGKPLREAKDDVRASADCFRYYADLIEEESRRGAEKIPQEGETTAFVAKEPVGVCALITPWNYPLLMAAQKIAPALAAGNSIVVKPASYTPLSTIRLFELLEEAGLPAGTANLVTGPGGTVGGALSRSRDVDMITFTGSTEVGRGIMEAAAVNIKKVALELGGKSPVIIFDDAELRPAAEWAMQGIFMNQGEICSAGSRILVSESVHDEFLALMVEMTEKMTAGDPMEDPDIGPLVSRSHMEKVLAYIESGLREGARCVCGGRRIDRKGYFVEPTIFDGCRPDMKIVREEIFGPVAAVQTFRDEDEAVAMANDTDYGLGGAVFTKDMDRAARVIREVRAGMMWANCYNVSGADMLWGGYGMSGIGRENGPEGLDEYRELKQVVISRDYSMPGWYV